MIVLPFRGYDTLTAVKYKLKRKIIYVGRQCFVTDLLWVGNLVCKKEDSVSCWFKTHQPRQGQRPTGRVFLGGFIRLFFLLIFLTDLKDFT
jgi:hypothetical protein